MFNDKPGDPFAARRRGQRAAEAIIVQVSREQRTKIEVFINRDFVVLFLRKARQQRVECAVFRADLKHNGKHRDVALFAGMNKVRFQRE